MLQFFHTLVQGGPVMVPLAVCSLAAVAVIIERACVLRRTALATERLMADIRRLCAEGMIGEALQRARQAPGPVATVLAAGLTAHLEGRRPAAAMEEQAMAELPGLNQRLSILDTIVTISPLLGLLGTVTGMIRSFGIIAQRGANHPAGITAGVAEALIATATGLVIAIVALVGYNYFQERVKAITAEIELRSTQLENLLPALREEPAPVALETVRA